MDDKRPSDGRSVNGTSEKLEHFEGKHDIEIGCFM